MNYYKRHLGDYARDTGHLSALEHGIYNLLLDWYYINERPIPADKAARIARGNPEETKTVLSEFFHRTENGWVHHRADREIQAYRERADRNRGIGALGGRPKKQQLTESANPEETQTVSRTNPNITLATNPLEDQKQKQKQDQDQELLKPQRSPRGSRLPPDWQPSAELVAWAAAERPDVDLQSETARFRDYWTAKAGKDGVKLDWVATFRNWVRNARQGPVKPSGNSSPPEMPTLELT